MIGSKENYKFDVGGKGLKQEKLSILWNNSLLDFDLEMKQYSVYHPAPWMNVFYSIFQGCLGLGCAKTSDALRHSPCKFSWIFIWN